MTLITFVVDNLQHLAQHADILAEPAPNVPDPGSGEAPAGIKDKVELILGWVAWLATAACVGGLILTGAKMAIAHRRGDDTNVSQLGWVFAACIIIGGASGIVGALL